MKILGWTTLSLFFSLNSFAADAVKEICRTDKPPSVGLYFPTKPGADEIKMVFTTPDYVDGKPDKKKSVKIQDKDGSVDLLLLAYLSQSPTVDQASLVAPVKAALFKRMAYWKAELAKTTDADRQAMIGNSIAAMNALLVKMTDEKKSLLPTEFQSIVKDVVGTMTDYDKTLKYESSEFKDGKFVSQPAKPLSEILPAEFYQTISSTSTGGVFDFKTVGHGNCVPLPVIEKSQARGSGVIGVGGQ